MPEINSRKWWKIARQLSRLVGERQATPNGKSSRKDHRRTRLILMLTLTFSTGVLGTHPGAGAAIAGRGAAREN